MNFVDVVLSMWKKPFKGCSESEHPLFRCFEHPVFIVELYQYLKGMKQYGHPEVESCTAVTGCEKDVLPLISIDFICGLA